MIDWFTVQGSASDSDDYDNEIGGATQRMTIEKDTKTINKSFKRGDQILYIPSHANGNRNHPDCERGFVTSLAPGGSVFCRYWSNRYPGELRTKANSEATPLDCLIHFSYTSKAIIENALEKFCKNP